MKTSQVYNSPLTFMRPSESAEVLACCLAGKKSCCKKYKKKGKFCGGCPKK